ncbi:MAG: polyprenyl diphosphate synthase [Burkholderiales bacterium]|jgi:undecaprenyl diphosphate synthase|nr:polyprenyl diphosphate synthase [Nitrosomonadaceae bacterium]
MTVQSPTLTIPEAEEIPRHVAIIMDGNGRWAKNRFMPRVAGHKRGVEAVRETVKACGEFGVKYLTLFAFSSENWRRPQEEVSVLMQLFLRALENEVSKLHENNIRFKVIGDLTPFDQRIRDGISAGEALTAKNDALTLTVAANYGGRWDILQAFSKVQQARALSAKNAPNGSPNGDFDFASQLLPITEEEFAPHLSMAYAPEPDLFIRTGGEERVSNFLLWQLAYTEFYFTPELWPDFGRASLAKAIESYQRRERRFGRTSEQLAAATGANESTPDAA